MAPWNDRISSPSISLSLRPRPDRCSSWPRSGSSPNKDDLAAWSSSVDHIGATPGFAGHPWPDEPMTAERNAEDLAEHVEDVDVEVRSWVTASRAELDIAVYQAVVE